VSGKDTTYASEHEAGFAGFRSRFPQNGTSGQPLRSPLASLDQNSPRPNEDRADLGEPLTIHAVAELLGCSPWTVRQRYLRQGLPHLRACARGRIVFFREQVIAWILKRQQQKGGSIR
jgi:hypothetical protein